jgi:hypothetical protein
MEERKEKKSKKTKKLKRVKRDNIDVLKLFLGMEDEMIARQSIR